MNVAWKRVVTHLSSALVIAISILYLLHACAKINLASLKAVSTIPAIEILIACTVSYSLFFSFFAVGWSLILLAIATPTSISFRDLFILYAKTNLMKYLPGNVMEWAGRNFFGVRYGLTHGQIALSSVIETAISLIVAGALSSFILMNGAWKFIQKTDFSLIIGIIIGLTSTLLTILFYVFIKYKDFFLKKRNELHKFYNFNFFMLLLKVCLIHFFIFLSLSASFISILHFILDIHIQRQQIFTIISAFALSWTLGFITPGAPGGVGIREALLVFTLSPWYGEQNILIVAGLHRLISILGDFLTFLISLWLPKKSLLWIENFLINNLLKNIRLMAIYAPPK